MNLNNNRMVFIGCDAPFADAQAVLFGAPFDGTTSFRPGTRFGPAAIRQDSYGLETYSPYQNRDMAEITVCDYGDLELPFGNAERALAEIEATAAAVLQAGKRPVMLGGEHLVTLGALRAAVQKYPNLQLLHFDAHTDLRSDYLGEVLSHACVIRRAYDLLGDGKIHHFGIRSGEKHEFDFAAAHSHMHAFSLDKLPETVAKLADAPVYVTIDLDVLDPACFPGTGTPEPGGVTYRELQQAIQHMAGLQVIGWDICELSPPYDHSGISTAAACKVVRETLLAFL